MALIGIYGVMSYAVAQRTREIRLRMDIGARPGEILSMMLKGAMAVAVAGILAGGLAATCLAALWIPALRAARVEPVQALRCE